MQAEFNLVFQFHQHIGATIATKPQLLACDKKTAELLAERLRGLCRDLSAITSSDDCLVQRVLLSLEETSEWLEAHAADDLEAAKDAWGDRCYVLIGDAVSAGLSVEAIFTAVHISNMTKRGINPINGKAIKSEDFQRPKLS